MLVKLGDAVCAQRRREIRMQLWRERDASRVALPFEGLTDKELAAAGIVEQLAPGLELPCLGPGSAHPLP